MARHCSAAARQARAGLAALGVVGFALRGTGLADLRAQLADPSGER